MNQPITFLLFCLTGALLVSGSVIAQLDNNSKLFKTLREKDSLMFEVGFNNCELKSMTDLMTTDLEFYHDKSGITNSRQAFLEVMKNGICNPNNSNRIKRHLVDDQLKVFPLYDNGKLYGALQNGVHYFSPEEDLKYKDSDNYAFFSHLWILEAGQWKLKRVISYNHSNK